ncbi:hypothetical protein BO83DRAFT_152810 [Aspergillus eucalypticola CBS 122712]|uniref:Uncharacterized protein n=1 Tax=Aspergillus eucalypticola (strain CBS 122712 / IBT 29274) TaxID=1448314 RepID=A0A317URG4_ASPEC|nr:uncharacterized protein BO83DRAFT_152810 [Aspergillus eucalypticola CBS 122712]PWY63806.1 hypothetical protein BO83DRAFT_152810 [Aspergillus eucalypticola CBS 122712]
MWERHYLLSTFVASFIRLLLRAKGEAWYVNCHLRHTVIRRTFQALKIRYYYVYEGFMHKFGIWTLNDTYLSLMTMPNWKL